MANVAECCARFQRIKTQLQTTAFRVWYNHCFYCGCKITKNKRKLGKSVINPKTNDHVIPASKGGGKTKWNLVPACRHCNGSKGSLSLEEFRLKIYKRSTIEFAGEILLRRWESQLQCTKT